MNSFEEGVALAGGTLGRQRHVCALFDSREEEYGVLLPFVKEGIERGEKAIHIVDPALRADHLARLHAGGIDVEAAQGRGQLEVRDWQDTYLRDGVFGRCAMTALVETMQRKARADGFPRARIIGHMEWALQGPCDVADLVEYEAKLNDILPRYDDPVVCTYDRARFGAGTAMDVLGAHAMAILDGALLENPCFLPSARLLRRPYGRHLAMLRDRYVTALVAGARREALEIVLEEALWQELPVPSLYLDVIQAAQYQIGRLWKDRRITTAQEHLATEISTLALAHLQPHLSSQPSNGGHALVACVEGELHELGARMVADFLEMAGFEVRFLGANVPTESLVQFVRERQPHLLALSATARSNVTALRRAIAGVRSVAGDRVAIAAGGQVFLRNPGLVSRLGTDLHARDAREMAAVAGRFFGEGRR